MRNRFYVPEGLRLDGVVELTGEEFHHAVRVHRSRLGDPVELFDGLGTAFEGRIDAIGKTSASVTITGRADHRESPLQITLAVALIHPDRFELVLQKGTELGVTRFMPLVTERVEVSSERATQKLDRWRKIILEATKQSGRAALPRIDEPVGFDKVLENPGSRILFDAEGQNDELPGHDRGLTVMIGPEGGWSPAEIEKARQAGCMFRRLGPRRLRAETAAIAALTQIASYLGDLSA